MPTPAQNLVGNVSSANNSGSIPSTPLYRVPRTEAGVRGGSGMYVVYADVLVTQAATAGTVVVSVTWTNPVNSSPELDSAAFSLAAIGEQAALLGNFMASEGATISYFTTISGASGNPLYTVNLRLQFLG